jgi:hypothetical protein
VQWQQVFNQATSGSDLDFLVQPKPLERLGQSEQADILNFQLKFVSYGRTLTSEEVEKWEGDFLQELQKLGQVSLR